MTVNLTRGAHLDNNDDVLLHFRKPCPICNKITSNDKYYIDVDLPEPGYLFDNKRILVCSECGLMRMLKAEVVKTKCVNTLAEDGKRLCPNCNDYVHDEDIESTYTTYEGATETIYFCSDDCYHIWELTH